MSFFFETTPSSSSQEARRLQSTLSKDELHKRFLTSYIAVAAIRNQNEGHFTRAPELLEKFSSNAVHVLAVPHLYRSALPPHDLRATDDDPRVKDLNCGNWLLSGLSMISLGLCLGHYKLDRDEIPLWDWSGQVIELDKVDAWVQSKGFADDEGRTTAGTRNGALAISLFLQTGNAMLLAFAVWHIGSGGRLAEADVQELVTLFDDSTEGERTFLNDAAKTVRHQYNDLCAIIASRTSWIDELLTRYYGKSCFGATYSQLIRMNRTMQSGLSKGGSSMHGITQESQYIV